MKFPCEIIVKSFLPIIKSIIIKELFEKYNLKQDKIAEILGITQSSVSLHISGKRGIDEIFKESEYVNQIKDDLYDLIAKLAEKKEYKLKFMNEICNICLKLQSTKFFQLLIKKNSDNK